MALEILVVDDERDIRDLVSGVLSDEGYECRTAGDSATQVGEHQVDLDALVEVAEASVARRLEA